VEGIELMAEMSKYYGLCETCEHDSTCMLRRSPILEIIQCEEFSIHPFAQKPSVAQTGVTMDAKDSAGMGLCANCLHVANCGFPNARCGVLQCEEYQLDEEGIVPPLTKYSKSAA
jgi:hypothetical protein